MRSNMMKECAVGAMLFGGTLSAAPVASGAVTVTWDRAAFENQNGVYTLVNDDVNFDYKITSGATAGAFGPGSISLAGSGPGFSFENSDDGFSMSSGKSVDGFLTASRIFTISGLGAGQGVSVSAMTNLVGVSAQLSISRSFGGGQWGSASYLNGNLAFAAGNGPLTTSGLLGNGTYQIGIMVGSEFGSTYDAAGTFASFTVPAPGAAALVGVAGLMTRRRKA